MQAEKHCQTFPLRIPASTRAAATELARRHGVSLNYFILVAITERIARMDSEARVAAREQRRLAEAASAVVAIDERT